ncbi:MAG: hypothetical protein FJ147_16410 [Deltaproteobacteria bacterium]|nr:hypothetical protein [Deltaproteobacteria bacterium]
MHTVEELIHHACQLSPQERQRLVAALEASLSPAQPPTPEASPATREEFAQRYQMTIDADLWALVGNQPATPVEDDKALIRDAVARRYAE